MKESAKKERRSDQVRRQTPLGFYDLFSCKGNRRTLRRLEDCKKIPLLDQYHPTLFIYTLIILGLSLVDAGLTLNLLHKGAVELNPVMRHYINLGPGIFIVVKYGLTACALTIMVLLHAVISLKYRFLSSILFPSCIVVFGSVIIWELYLLSKLSPV